MWILSYAIAMALGRLACLNHRDRFGFSIGLVTHADIFERPKGTYDLWKTLFYRNVTPKAYFESDIIVALSPHMAKCAIEGGAGAHRVRLVPNGLVPREIGISSNEQYQHTPPSTVAKLLYVGRLSVEKGVDILVEAAAILRKSNVKFSLKIVGEGREKEALIRAVSKLGLEDCVQFVPFMERVKLGDLYRSADITVIPSRSEPFGLTVAESMVAGTPVVGTSVGGIPYLVEDDVTGAVVSSENPQALADAIALWIRRLATSDKKRERAFARFTQEYSWQMIGQKLSQAINEAPRR